ncbi:hypothetical protein lerEdw1_000380 [Lerista edwardsae]|nr:hypothetical protein lerEdw1_000380 [Lerista edwardsae]
MRGVLSTRGAALIPKSAIERLPLIKNLGMEKEKASVYPLNSIAAVCQNMGIGKNGQLPWPPLRNEFQYFQRMTMTAAHEDLQDFIEMNQSMNDVSCADDNIRTPQVVDGENIAYLSLRQSYRNIICHYVIALTIFSCTGKQNVVIMGKKTWFSIPEKNRPLKGRINIVLSKEMKEAPKGAHFLARSLDEALNLIKSSELASKTDMIWIVGGSSVYKAAMDKPINQRLFVTRILHEFESDTFFPEIDLEKYRLLPEYPGVPTDIQEENGIQYKFEVYEKSI